MRDLKKLKKKIKEEIEEMIEVDEETEHPVHERFVKQKKIRKV